MKNEIRASIDIGSNSTLLLIAEFIEGNLKEIVKKSEITALGKDLDKLKVFHPESMETTFEVLRAYAKICDSYKIPRESIVATATEASRIATNSNDFFAKVKTELCIDVNIITSYAEAYLTSLGVQCGMKFSDEFITIIDIGGASTELIKVNLNDMQILHTISMPVGAVRSTQWLQDNLFVQNLNKIFLDFRSEIDQFQGCPTIGAAGTFAALGNMFLGRKDFVEEKVHGLVLKSQNINQLFRQYESFSPEEFLKQFPFLQKRSQSIRGGLHLVYHLTHRLLFKDLRVSTYGLLYGSSLQGRINKEFIYGRN